MTREELEKSQPTACAFFKASLTKDRLVNVYLIEGRRGSPKEEIVKYFAELIFCKEADKEKRPCGECRECRRIEEGVHPSIFRLSPVNGAISLAQVESLEHEFALLPLEDGSRLFVIESLERLALSSSQKLLKFLEELRPNDYGLLLCENARSALPTIRSRAQIVTLLPGSSDEVVKALLDKGLDATSAHIIARVTTSRTEALALSDDEVVQSALLLLKKLASALLDGGDEALLIFRQDGARFLRDARALAFIMEGLVAFYDDLLLFNLDPDTPLIYESVLRERENDIPISALEIVQDMETVLKYKERLRLNIQPELALMEMFLELRG